MKYSKIVACSVVIWFMLLPAMLGCAPQPRKPVIPETFEELVQLSDEELEVFDVARMNLLCAKGLPGSENLDIEQCLQKLDEWTLHVLRQEKKYLPAFFQNLEKYKNSMALFKGAYLGYAVQGDFKCGYNEALVESGAMDDWKSTRFFHDSSDIFINGLIEEGNGCCSSLPVLMVALGRRCKYPVYLVGCAGHMFTRWDDGTEQVNLEITCSKGVKTEPDEHYKKWPRSISDKEIAEERHLKNYTGKEMLGIFASLRGVCLKEHKRYEESKQCYEIALQSFPDSRILRLSINDVDEKLKQKGKGDK